jgi:hypothetical protein
MTNTIEPAIALEMRHAGKTFDQIAAELRCTRSAVQCAVRRAVKLGLGTAHIATPFDDLWG